MNSSSDPLPYTQVDRAALPEGHLPGGRELFLFGLDSAIRVVRARSWRIGPDGTAR